MALNDNLEVDRIIAFLNDLLERDRAAVSKLFAIQVECNDALDTHPTVQTGPDMPGGPSTFGLLGILNGLCGTIEDPPFVGWGPIARVVGADGMITRFARTVDTVRDRHELPTFKRSLREPGVN